MQRTAASIVHTDAGSVRGSYKADFIVSPVDAKARYEDAPVYRTDKDVRQSVGLLTYFKALVYESRIDKGERKHRRQQQAKQHCTQ